MDIDFNLETTTHNGLITDSSDIGAVPELASKTQPLDNKPEFRSDYDTEVKHVLGSLFAEGLEENKLQFLRKASGISSDTLNDEQLEKSLTEFQFLINTWLDEFEKQIFQGKTLKELLGTG